MDIFNKKSVTQLTLSINGGASTKTRTEYIEVYDLATGFVRKKGPSIIFD